MADTRPVLTDGRRTFTIPQLHKTVMGYAAALRAEGVRKGDRVLVTGGDSLEAALVLLACIAGGFICVPVSRTLDPESREAVIRDCAPRLILDGPPRPCPPAPETRPLCGEDTLVYLLYTSGSTGCPKGVAARQRQILFCCNAIGQRLALGPGDRILCSLPLSFDYGMYQIFLSLLSGASLFLDGSGVPQRIPYLLNHSAITVFPTLPTVANLLLQAGMLRAESAPDLRCITFTGEVLPVPLIRRLLQCLPGVRIVPMYGMTECKRVSVMPAGRDDKLLAGSCGLPLDGVAVWLEHKDAATGVGELVVSGDNVMDGYWGRESQPVFFTDLTSGRRCLRTGDLFQIDSEGFLYFRGRRNDILKLRGRRVSALWIEEQLGADALEAAAVGIPDPLLGERAAVFLYVDSKARANAALKRLGQMPAYCQDLKVIFTKSPLPRNRNGKLDRRTLRRLAEEAT